MATHKLNPYFIVRHKATLWYKGRTVTLGRFLSEQVRDEAVEMGKTLRNMGFDIDTIRETVNRLKNKPNGPTNG